MPNIIIAFLFFKKSFNFVYLKNEAQINHEIRLQRPGTSSVLTNFSKVININLSNKPLAKPTVETTLRLSP